MVDQSLFRTIDAFAYGIASNREGTLLALGNRGVVELWGIPD